MSLQRVDGVLDVVLRAADADERAAAELVRFSLYESLTEQIEVARPRLEQDGVQLLAKRAAQARTSLLRSTVGKALDGVDEPADLDTAANLAIIDAYVSKSLVGTVLDIFNRKHPHGEGGRFVSTNGAEEGSHEEGQPRSQNAVDAAAMFTRARSTMANQDNSAKGAGTNAEQWNRPGSIGDRQAYRRMSMTGSALSAVSAPGSTGRTIGDFAQLAGNIGPEAEKVLGPGMRRTAYRYRGTERRPDKTLVADVAAAQSFADGLAGDDPARSHEETMKQILGDFGAPAQKEATPSAGAAANYLRPAYKNWDRDQYELAIRGDTAAIDLLAAIPDKELTKISIAAGELPPSQGVIIDADGDVTSQAQGFNGDHYLPFDLKNLADLHGGQYVRTRAAGGPTTEDIYTGLLSGARQLQVISNSGVYSVEFDPGVRGGRRYTDKAVRMIGRYSKLLEAIDGGGLYENDIDAATRRQLRQKAYEQTGWNAKEGNDRYIELRDEARLKSSYNQADEDERFKDAVAQVREQNKKNRTNPNFQGQSDQQFYRDVDDIVREGNADAATQRVRQMVLDGKGYAKALMTLKQEFPFYIRDVRYETIPEFVEARKAPMPPMLDPNAFSRDTGRVRPGQTNAHASLSRDDGRLVATGKPKQAGETKETSDTPAASNNAGSSRSVGGSELKPPVKDETGVVVTTEGDTIPLTDLIREQPHWAGDLERAIAKTAPAFNSLGNDDLVRNGHRIFQAELQETKESDVMGSGGTNMGYAEYMTTKMSQNGTGVANWLLTQSNPDQRKRFVQGFKDASHELDELNDNAGASLKSDMAGNDYDKLVARIEAITSLVQPFAVKANLTDNSTTARPDQHNPLPQPWSSITQLGNKVENYDKYLSEARSSNPLLAEKVDTYSASVKKAPDEINDMLDELRKLKANPAHTKDEELDLHKQLGASQAAWAYVVARKIAEGVDESPKAAAPQGPPAAEVQDLPAINPLGAEGNTKQVVKSQRRMVFHKNSEAYEQAMAKAFKMR